MKVVRIVLHKVAQSTAFNQWRDFFGASTTILSLHLGGGKYAYWNPIDANRLSPKTGKCLINAVTAKAKPVV